MKYCFQKKQSRSITTCTPYSYMAKLARSGLSLSEHEGRSAAHRSKKKVAHYIYQVEPQDHKR